MLVWVIKMLRNWQKRKQRSCVLGSLYSDKYICESYNPETAATDGGVAIIDKYDLEATPTKSTVAQVYDFIIKDIEEALPYLQEEPVNVYHPSKAFGYALAARVYLFHRDWKKAKEAAEESLKLNNTLIDYIDLGAKGGPTKVTTYAKGGNPEVLNYAYMGVLLKFWPFVMVCLARRWYNFSGRMMNV